MPQPQPKQSGYTLEDWTTWEGRWELINGIAYDMNPAPSLEHQRIATHLVVAIGNALEGAKRKAGGGECEVHIAPLRTRTRSRGAASVSI